MPRALLLTGDAAEELDTMYPYYRVQEGGWDVDVANKYRSDKNAQAALEKKVKDGGVGVWGQIPMPPNAQVPQNDIKELVAWILALKK